MAAARADAGLTQVPRSVEQITRSAQEYEYDANVPLRYWLRTASALLKQAEVYNLERDDEATYLLLFRHSHLVLANLAQHPEAKDKALRPQLKEAEREVNHNLVVLDGLKPKLKERYNRYAGLQRERDRWRSQHSGGTVEARFTDGREERLLQSNVKRLEARENRDLAVRLAQKELSRRATSRIPPVHESRSERDDLSQQLQAINLRIGSGQRHGSVEERDLPRRNDQRTSTYHYPTMPSRPQADVHSPPPQSPTGPLPPVRSFSYDSAPPNLPPKPAQNNHAIPPRPDKVAPQTTARPPPTKPAPTAAVEPAYTFAPSAYLENGTPLRTIFLPQTLRTTFLRIAYKNTTANLETCAFLAGTLIANAFFISKLIIPAQTATSDTCEMTNESDLFDYVDSENLMILGWIHTHPTQTCFMSSRDLHTHAGYQMMLAESVAIVCAPSKGDTTFGGDWGAYRLTDPPGKKVILNCDKPGVFHPHEVDNVYTDAMRPGHVVEAKGMEFDVVDLRKI